MSLHVYLDGDEEQVPCRCTTCDYEHARTTRETFYSANITHNLADMAKAAGVYQYLWRPEEVGVERAAQLIGPLAERLDDLRAHPDQYRALNPSNGWGDYEGLVRFVKEYLAACREHPTAHVRIWR